MSNVIRSLVVKVGADTTDFANKMKNISKDLTKTGKSISKAGSTLTKGITLPILGAAAGIGAMVVKAGEGADELITMANKTGLSTQKLQELGYAARFIDVEVETMTDSVVKLTRSMDGARDGTGAQAEAFAKIGVAVTNVDGSLRDANTVFMESIDALGKIENETERDAAALALFGRSAQELNPLIKAGSDELNRLSKEAHDVGAVMSDESVTSLGKFDDAMQKMKATLSASTNQIAGAFAPAMLAMQPVLENTIIPAITKFAQWIANLMQKFAALEPGTQKFILSGIAAAAAVGPVVSVVGGLITKLGGAFGAVSKFSKALSGGSTIIKALGVMIGPGGAILLGLAAFATAAILIWKNWDKITAAVKKAIDKVKTFFGIKDKDPGEAVVLTKGYGKYTQYAKGTNYVPNDGLAYLHKGEAVVPAKYNNGGGNTTTINHTGTIRVEGVSSKGELMGVVELLGKQISQDNRRLPNRASVIPI